MSYRPSKNELSDLVEFCLKEGLSENYIVKSIAVFGYELFRDEVLKIPPRKILEFHLTNNLRYAMNAPKCFFDILSSTDQKDLNDYPL